MSLVSIVRCETYAQPSVDAALRQSVELCGGLDNLVSPGDRVLLKVNMLNADPPEKAVTTHPTIARAAIRLIKDYGASPFLGDASGIAYTRDGAEKAWEVTGLRRAARDEGVPAVTLRTPRKISNPANRKVPLLHLAAEALEADVVISLAKLKTHNFALFTGAIKNLYGVIPGFRKKELHAIVPRPDEFAELMADILEVLAPQFAIMDGIVGMEGDGPAAGPPREIGLVLASRDFVAMDAVASRIIGYEPLQVDITRVAAERGLGEADLERVKIAGELLNSVCLSDFALASSVYTMLNRVPRPLWALGRALAPYLFHHLLQVNPAVVREVCRGCGDCVQHCPTGAIKMKRGYPAINRSKCIRCLCCQEFCQEGAIKVKYNWLARAFRI